MKAIVFGARPKTLIASLVPVLSIFLYYDNANLLKAPSLLINCLLVGIFIQIATNYFNDYYDYIKGADTERVGPDRYAGEQLSSLSVLKLAYLSLAIAAMASIPLLGLHWGFQIAGFLSAYFAYGYTAGPYPLAYNALGELFVLLFFGLVACLGTAYAIAHQWTTESILLSFLQGFFSILIIGGNNIRDLDTDEKVYKRTLAVILGEKRYKFFLISIVLMIYLLSFIYYEMRNDFLPFALIIIFGLFYIFRLRKAENPSDHARNFPLAILFLLLFFLGEIWLWL